MARTKAPDLTLFDRAPADASRRGVRVMTAQELGEVVRFARLQRFGRREDATAQLGVSPRMLGALERGNAGARVEAVLHLLTDLGLDVVLVPRDPHRSLRDPAPRAAPTGAAPQPDEAP
ncbi:MAG TPA: hypothetical protein VMV51_03740 [Gemmatimonadaceae bacterium]|nr:hypothetical protein [Gemmatimonadaceae bacterium]